MSPKFSSGRDLAVLTAEIPQQVQYMYCKCPTLANYVHTVSLLQLKGNLDNYKWKCIVVSLGEVWYEPPSCCTVLTSTSVGHVTENYE